MRGAALNRPNLIARVVTLLAAAAMVVVVLSVASGSSSYVLRLKMANASGLQTGSQVFLGGVPIGSVKSLNMNHAGNAVVATLDLQRGAAHIGQGVRANVIATNLLGTKSVQLTPGNRNQPLRSGTTLPISATTIPTDLDQVVDVLDQPTRVDLQLMLGEAGLAVAGRRSDVGAVLRQLPLSLTAATKLLHGLVRDNHSIADFIANSNAFIAAQNAAAPQLTRLITAAAGASKTFSDKAVSLAHTVQGAPLFFTRVNHYFAAITGAANRLNPVAGTLADTLPSVDATLKAIGPFANAAVPTLNRAAQIAPSLTVLAKQATPTLRKTEPTLASIANLARLSKPLSGWLNVASPDLFAIFAGWTHAIQARDGVSHIFNGDLYLNPQIVLNAADQGATAKQKAQNLVDLSPALVSQLGLASAVAKARAYLNGLGLKVPDVPTTAPASGTPAAATHSGASGTTGAVGDAGTGAPSSSGGVLGGVLGGVTGALSGTHGSGGTTSPPSGSGGTVLPGLLGYLFGK